MLDSRSASFSRFSSSTGLLERRFFSARKTSYGHFTLSRRIPFAMHEVSGKAF